MRFIVMFVTAVCVLFLNKLRWPKRKNFYDRRCSVFELVPLRGENNSSHAHKAGSWYFLVGVPFKISAEQPCSFHMGVSSRGGERTRFMTEN